MSNKLNFQEEPIFIESIDEFTEKSKNYSQLQKFIVICPDCGKKKEINKRCINFRCKDCLVKYRKQFYTEESYKKGQLKRKETINNWPEYKKQEYKQKLSNKAKISNKNRKLSSDSKLKLSNSLKEAWSKKSLEDINKRSKKRKETINNWSEEERECHRSNYKKAQDSLRNKHSIQTRNYWSSLSLEEKKKLVSSFRPKKYEVDGLLFDSSYELCFYLKHKNENIIREPCCFEYTYNNESHLCFPDFSLNGELIEIKGEQFLKEGRWINPYCRSLDDVYEAKRQCLINHNVKIFYYNDIKDCVDYVISNYGENYKDIFRRKK